MVFPKISDFCYLYINIYIYVLYYIYVANVCKLLFWSFRGSNRSGLVTKSGLWIGSCGTIHFQFQ